MDIQQRKSAFVQLGQRLKAELNDENGAETALQSALRIARYENAWFDELPVRTALERLSDQLTESHLNEWLAQYPTLDKVPTPKNVGLIMAGNIPLVGFHDLLSVLISGHHVVAKTSSKDRRLMLYVISALIEIEPDFQNRIRVTEDRMPDIDAIIATGSNNSAGYLEYYFGKYPHIIRKNRTAVAILDGSETEEELQGLGEDLFQYYGLGCRNVSKLLVSEDYDFAPFFKAIFPWKWVLNNAKYFNNYEYNKTIFLLNNEPMIENGFITLKEDTNWSSPVGMLFYERFSNPYELEQHLTLQQDALQCVIGHKYLPFGAAQRPDLWDYADGVDTLKFLIDLSH